MCILNAYTKECITNIDISAHIANLTTFVFASHCNVFQTQQGLPGTKELSGELGIRTPQADSELGLSVVPLAPLVPLVWSLRAWLALPSTVSLAHSDHQAWLCDSVRPVSPQVQGCPLHFSESCRCHVLRVEIVVLLAKDAIEPVLPAV